MDAYRDTQRSYDRLSRWYDFLSGPWEREARDEGVIRLDAQPGDTVLEIGPGTGIALLSLAKVVFPHGKVFGIDISTSMLKVCREKIRNNGYAQHAHLACGNALYLPYANAAFRAIFMCFTLELFPPDAIPLVLAECRRVLKEDGRVTIASLSDERRGNRSVVAFYNWCRSSFPRLVDCRLISLHSVVLDSGWSILYKDYVSLWGLPVEIVTVVDSLGGNT